MALPEANTDGYAANVSAAAQIFAEYGDFIYSIIYSKTKNKDQIDDLYQNFFISLVSKPIPLSVDNIRAYLYRAITNDVIDATRRVERYKSLIVRYIDDLKFSTNKISSANAISREEGENKVLNLMKKRLHGSEFKAIILKYNNCYSNEEIANEIGIKKESVSRYISVGLKKIQQILEAEEDT